jgi:hypothetical protein
MCVPSVVNDLHEPISLNLEFLARDGQREITRPIADDQSGDERNGLQGPAGNMHALHTRIHRHTFVCDAGAESTAIVSFSAFPISFPFFFSAER